mmetsp:Transcript_28648/g.61445  ORF Transcript_28648/g.61445 Transcript_28648/m.61445 type:complete len:338 (+) Transcript_28648:75-1088(+)
MSSGYGTQESKGKAVGYRPYWLRCWSFLIRSRSVRLLGLGGLGRSSGRCSGSSARGPASHEGVGGWGRSLRGPLAHGEQKVVHKVFGPFLSVHSCEKPRGGISVGRIGIVGLGLSENHFFFFWLCLGAADEVEVGFDVSLKGREEVSGDDVLVIESCEQHLFREMLGFVVKLGTHASLEGIVLFLDWLEQVFVWCCVIFFSVVDGLEVYDGEVFLSVEGQQIDSENRKVVFWVGVPDGVVNLRVVTGVVVSHANLAVFLGGKADVHDPCLLLFVRVVGEVGALFVLAFNDLEIREVFFHEVHLPFPKGHVQEFIVLDFSVDGGFPRHAVFGLGFSDR